jgi:hypothetical protein
MKQAAYIRSLGRSAFTNLGMITNRKSSLGQWLAGCGTQESDRVEEVGLPDSIRSGNAREGTEADFDIDQVLEAANSEAGEHGA